MKAAAIASTVFVRLLVLVLVGTPPMVEGKVDAPAPVPLHEASSPAVEHAAEGFLYGAKTARASVTLHDGGALPLERGGDLGSGNAGLLVFVEGRERPDYVAWRDIVRIDFHRPALRSPD